MKVETHGKLHAFKAFVCLVLMGGMACLSTLAHAEYVAGETPTWQGLPLTSYVQGGPTGSLNSSIVVHGTSLIVNQLSLPSSGVLTIKLADIKWPDTLSTLSLLVTDLGNTWQTMDGAGNLLVGVSGPTQLFAAVFGRGAGSDGWGLYNLRADFTPGPVPLPAAVWLMLSGMGGIALIRRRKR